MNQPTVYLVSNKLTPEQIETVKAALLITPLSAVIICDIRDAAFAHNFCDTVSNLKQPIALVADFDEPLTAITEDGSLSCLSISSQTVSTESST